MAWRVRASRSVRRLAPHWTARARRLARRLHVAAELRGLRHMWTSEAGQWALLRTEAAGDGDEGYLPFDTRCGAALIIEDDALAADVVRRMRRAGVRVID